MSQNTANDYRIDLFSLPLIRAREWEAITLHQIKNTMSTQTQNLTDETKEAAVTQCFAVPGRFNSIIDVVRPSTGNSWINGETLEKIRERYPTAEIVNFDEWCAAKAALQDETIVWTDETEEQYYEMLECLPPAAMKGGGFLVGEPADHHATTGRPRYEAHIQRDGKFLVSSRPMTVNEFKMLFPQ